MGINSNNNNTVFLKNKFSFVNAFPVYQKEKQKKITLHLRTTTIIVIFIIFIIINIFLLSLLTLHFFFIITSSHLISSVNYRTILQIYLFIIYISSIGLVNYQIVIKSKQKKNKKKSIFEINFLHLNTKKKIAIIFEIVTKRKNH